jgi:hypothetical protein
MAFTKTRIWRGGVAGSVAGEHEGDAVGPSEEPTSPRAAQADTGSDLDAEANWERAAQVRAAQAPHFDADQHTPPFAITRLWPIEQLFPDEHGAQTPPPTVVRKLPANAPAWSRPSPLEGTLKLWWRGLRARAVQRERSSARSPSTGRVGVALLCVTLVVAAVQLLPRARDRLRPAHAASPPALPEPPAALLRATRQARTEDAAPAAHAPSVLDRGAVPAGLERSAIDALVAGDLARAGQLYQRLAQAAPHDPAFGEALRVIASQTSGAPAQQTRDTLTRGAGSM